MADKPYSPCDQRDETKPIIFWFQESHEGLVLFVVFYTLACRWGVCSGCNLPSLSSKRHVGFKQLMAQIDWLYSEPEIMAKRKDIRKIILSNNGSVLDEETFSSTALIYFVAKTNIMIPNLDVLSIETRTEYVDLEELEFLGRALKEGDTPTDLELAIGFEAHDDRIRNKVFKKGLSLRAFEDFAKKLAKFNFRLKCYFMQKPVPGMTDEEAVRDIQNGIDYLDVIAARFGLKINMHLNPTYVASGTSLEDAFRREEYKPPKLHDVAKAALHAMEKKISVYIGLFDEGLAVPGGSFIRLGDEALIKKMEEFNRTQDFSFLYLK